MRQFVFAVFAVFSFSATAYAAGVNIVASESGGDVILTGSGEIDLSGTSLFNPSFQFSTNSDLSHPNFFAGVSQGLASIYELPNFVSFTPLNNSFFNLVPTGDVFAFQGDFPTSPAVTLPSGYSSLDPIDFVWTVSGATIAGLGLNFGTVGEFGDNTITLSAVPLPAPILFVLSGLGSFVLLRRRSQRANSA